jgi:benzoate membrane transport protein
MRNYFSISNLTAGFIAVLIGFTGSVAIVIQAATTAGASQAEMSSWFFALGFSIAATCIGLSLYCRMPILTGWSTPGAAILVTSLSGHTMPEATGAFVFSAILTILTGATGLFSAIMSHIPRALASAMLAGILLHFGMNVFVSMQDQMTLVSTMLVTYLIGKRFFPRYVIILVLISSILTAGWEGLLHLDHIQIAFATPIFTTPVFTFSSLISIGIPLFIVNTTSQNIPGLAAINSSGYQPPISKLITWKGVAMLFFAPFGCYSIGLAALTAAICTGEEADIDPANRYKSTIFAGICWIFVGIFGATVVALFFALPKELIYALAGLALFTTIGSSLKTALDEEMHREPAIITILVCASGISLFGIGSAFWGLIAGVVSSLLLNWHKRTIAVGAETIADTR